MILESGQMLSTANRVVDKSDDDILYRESYKNHPSTKWVRTNLYHYTWLWSLFNSLGEEFISRYNNLIQLLPNYVIGYVLHLA